MKFTHLLLLACALVATGCQGQQILGTVTAVENKVLVDRQGSYKTAVFVTIKDRNGNLQQVADLITSRQWDIGDPYIVTLSRPGESIDTIGQFALVQDRESIKGYEIESSNAERAAAKDESVDEEEIKIDLSGEVKRLNDDLKDLRQQLDKVKPRD